MHSGTALHGYVKAAAFAIGLVLASYSAINWWSIFIDHAPPCSPECASDFVTFYAAAKQVRNDAASLYDLDQQFAYQSQIAPLKQVYPFVYPPITALLISPVAWLSFSSAYLLMTLLNMTLVSVSIQRLIRSLHMSRDQSHWLLLFVFCNYGVHQIFYQIQTSVIVLCLLTCLVLADRASQLSRAGVWMSLFSAKPQYSPIPNLILLLQGKWRSLSLSLMLSAILTVGGFFALGVESVPQYLLLARRMATVEQDWWNPIGSMHNLRSVAIFWFPPAWKNFVWGLSSALVIGGVIWINLRARSYSVNFQLRWIANVLAILLVTPHLFTHDLSILILPCALLLSRMREPVPILAGTGLIALAVLPVINFAYPTMMAIVLLVLYVSSLIYCCANSTSS